MLEPEISEAVSTCSSRHTNLPETSQAAAWSHKYIGFWNGETEGWIRNHFFEGSRLEMFPKQKWSISNLWEHFFVSEHRKPFWSISY